MTHKEREKEKRCSECVCKVSDSSICTHAGRRGGRLRDARGHEGAHESTSG